LKKKKTDWQSEGTGAQSPIGQVDGKGEGRAKKDSVSSEVKKTPEKGAKLSRKNLESSKKWESLARDGEAGMQKVSGKNRAERTELGAKVWAICSEWGAS